MFPNLFKRLFGNNGTGPKLRGDILPYGTTAHTVCAGNDARVSCAEAWRQSWIGVPRWWRSTTLPLCHVWANGDLVLFEDWPELEAVYRSGGFTGILLPAGSSSATIAANLGKWVETANSAGLYTPNLGGQFFRNWSLGQTIEAGRWGRDEIRNITGTYYTYNYLGGVGRRGAFEVPTLVNPLKCHGEGTDASWQPTQFDSSWVIPTGPQNVPQHVWQPCLIYLGQPK